MSAVRQKILALLTIAQETSEATLDELVFPQRYIHSTFSDKYHTDSIYKAIRRLLREELIEKIDVEGKTHLKITETGKKEVVSQVPFFRSERGDWDGHWRLVLFDVPEEKRHRRDFLRRYLRQLGLGQWQRSVWISPFDVEKPMENFINERPQYRPHIEILKAKRISSGSEKELANLIWKLDEINYRYQELAVEWESAFEEYEEDFRGLAKLASKLKEQFVSLLLEDPGLPYELLPNNWQADKAEQSFLEWKTILEAYK